MNLSLSKLPWHSQLGIFVAVSAAAVAVFHNFYVRPAEAELATRQQWLTALRVNINRGAARARKLPEFQREVGELEARLSDLRAVLPQQKDVADLLRHIQTLATQSNLTIRSFKPAPMSTKQLHAEWPIVLELDGAYHNLAFFFDSISNVSRIINVSNVEIRAKVRAPGERQDPASSISARCVATTFVLLDAARAAAADPNSVKGGGS